MKQRTLPSLLLALVCLAADWPQWRGANRDDVSRETGLLKTWPDKGPRLLGTFEEAGIGYSGLAVVGDRFYTLGADAQVEYAFAVDLKTLKKAWSTEVGKFYKNAWGSGPRSTPTVDGPLTYVLSGEGNLVCLKTATGEKVWSKSLSMDLGGGRPNWGYTESVLVDGDQVVCTPGGGKGAIAALNKQTGDLIWQSKEFTDGAQYSSLVPAEIGGVRQYVQMTAGSVVGVAAKDGKLLWHMAKSNPTAAVPTPIVAGDLVYATSGYSAGCALYKIEGNGGGLNATEVYANKNMVNHHGGVVRIDDYLYGFSEGKNWICQDLKTGEIVWQERRFPKGSVTFADGNLYCFGEDSGSVALVEATPKGWNEKGRFTIPQRTKQSFPRNRRAGNNVWTHPVAANGKLFLRDQEFIFVYDVSQAQ